MDDVLETVGRVETSNDNTTPETKSNSSNINGSNSKKKSVSVAIVSETNLYDLCDWTVRLTNAARTALDT